MISIKQLESRIKELEDRAREKDTNKAWETSWTRRILIALFTYFSIALYLKFIVKLDNPWINAVIPSIGFLLSTLTLPFLKNLWEKHIYKRQDKP